MGQAIVEGENFQTIAESGSHKYKIIHILNEKTSEIFKIESGYFYDAAGNSKPVQYGEQGKFLPNLQILGEKTPTLNERNDNYMGYVDSNSNLFRYLPEKYFGHFHDGKDLLTISLDQMDFLHDNHTEKIIWKSTDSPDIYKISSTNLSTNKKQEFLFTWTSVGGAEGWSKKEDKKEPVFYPKIPDFCFGTFEDESGIWFTCLKESFHYDGNYFSRLDWNSKGFVVENLGEFVWRTDGVEGYSFLKKDSTERVLSKKISDDRLFPDKRTMFEKIKDDTGISLAINIYNNGIKWMK
jgi:hypothetical protein